MHRREGAFESAAALLRERTAAEHNETAARRDAAARSRDLAAQARDHAAEAGAPEHAAGDREHAAGDRERAADDREHAADDREQATRDREQAGAELGRAHLDNLTGAYRRELGELALRHEIARAQRSGGPLALAFVDVDGLKDRNDGQGHAAGDALLREVVTAVRSKVRSYDPVVRFGGDEFVCGLSQTDLDGARRRFDEIRGVLRLTRDGGSISVGFAELRPNETLEDLTARGDAALYEAKHER